MKILRMEQRSDEWWAARSGLPTASSFNKIVTSTGKKSAQWETYLFDLAYERVTGTQEDTYMSAEMLEGRVLEEEARWVFSAHLGVLVDQVGFCLSDDGRYGCSPDGIIDNRALLEIKCPKWTTQVKYHIVGGLPYAYKQQVQGSLMVTGFDMCYFFSYNDGVKPFLLEVEREEDYIEEMGSLVVQFCDELDELCDRISVGSLASPHGWG